MTTQRHDRLSAERAALGAMHDELHEHMMTHSRHVAEVDLTGACFNVLWYLERTLLALDLALRTDQEVLG